MSTPTTEFVCVDCSRLELPRKCAACEKLDPFACGMRQRNKSPVPDTRSNTLEQLARVVLNKLEHQGYCVIDKFHKEETALAVLAETRHIHQSGLMHNGQLTSTLASEDIRGDLIAWIEGKEEGTESISRHMRRVDALVRELNKGISYHVIEGRTQVLYYGCGDTDDVIMLHKREVSVLGRFLCRGGAMVACYPGAGKKYRKHVDNPNQDGRCLTTIYYLNKDYDRMVNGGVLRLYPHGGEQYVDIEPILDRLFIFWSDRRNPHEVLPAHTTRYAITLWYFDKEEREAEYLRWKELKEACQQDVLTN